MEGIVDPRVLHWQGCRPGQEGDCTPLTNGRCRDCLVWDVDEACRIQWPRWPDTTVNFCSFCPGARLWTHVCSLQRGTRGFQHRCVSTPEKQNKVDATDELTTGGKTTCPRPSMEHGTLRPCAKFWCAASACSMGTRHFMTYSKKTHTERHGTLVVHTQVSSSSQFSQVIAREMCTPGWVKEARVPDSDVVLFQQETSLSHDGLRRSCSFEISVSRRQEERETTSSSSKEKDQQHCRGAVDTSTRAVACALTSKPQPLLLLHVALHSARVARPSVLSPASFKSHQLLLIDRGGNLASNTLHPGSAAQELRGSGAPGAPATFKGFGNPSQATSPLPHSSRNQIACL